MLKGYTLPRTPGGTSSLAPSPPWHYVGECTSVEYDADADAIASFLPPGLDYASTRCAVYFIEWQSVTDGGEEYLDPVYSQYKETIVLLSASYRGVSTAYCPFIWVDQDVSLMRGLIQGWPKQIGYTHVTRAYDLSSPANPLLGAGGKFGATLSAKEQRLVRAQITLNEETSQFPTPGFAGAINVRYFPNLQQDKYEQPAVHQLVRLTSRDTQFSTLWKGEAQLEFYKSRYTELMLLRPQSVAAGYRFTFALTVDEIELLRDFTN